MNIVIAMFLLAPLGALQHYLAGSLPSLLDELAPAMGVPPAALARRQAEGDVLQGRRRNLHFLKGNRSRVIAAPNIKALPPPPLIFKPPARLYY